MTARPQDPNRPIPALVAFDLDGTLYDSRRVPLPSSLAAIRVAQDRGVRVALASGRDAWALRHLAEGFGLDPSELLLFGLNGTEVVDGATGEVLWSADLPADVLGRLMEHLRGFEVTPSIPAGPDLYIEDADGFNVDVEARLNGQRLVVVDRLEDADVVAHKVLVSGRPEVLQRDHRAIREPFGDVLDFCFSAPTHLECTPAGVNKGTALRRYCELSGTDLADTVAFGDHENDIEMLRTAGLGVAMGNAQPSVKEAADVVTADNDSDGIALLLGERFGLG